MINKGYICLNDKELKNIKKENLFVILTEKQAKNNKKFYERRYGVHHNILNVKVNIQIRKHKKAWIKAEE